MDMSKICVVFKVRGFTTNLEVMSSIAAGFFFHFLPIQIFLKARFWFNHVNTCIVKFETSKPVNVL